MDVDSFNRGLIAGMAIKAKPPVFANSISGQQPRVHLTWLPPPAIQLHIKPYTPPYQLFFGNLPNPLWAPEYVWNKSLVQGWTAATPYHIVTPWATRLSMINPSIQQHGMNTVQPLVMKPTKIY